MFQCLPGLYIAVFDKYGQEEAKYHPLTRTACRRSLVKMMLNVLNFLPDILGRLARPRAGRPCKPPCLFRFADIGFLSIHNQIKDSKHNTKKWEKVGTWNVGTYGHGIDYTTFLSNHKYVTISGYLP